MDPISQQLMMGAAGSGNAKTYIEDVFSTWLYTGNGSTQTITNGIDLSGKGGLVWTKLRNSAFDYHVLQTSNQNWAGLYSNRTDGQNTGFSSFLTPTATGYTVGANYNLNANNEKIVSWTFRKAAKFFDVVTTSYTGSSITVGHGLGSVPGCIIMKLTTGADNWYVYHRSNTGVDSTGALNTTNAFQSPNGYGNFASNITSTSFTLDANFPSGTYVFYLFAHDAGGFGDSGNESVIKCGSYTGNGSAAGPIVNLGWEPQWVLIKNATQSMTNWFLHDSMRGIATDGSDAYLVPNDTSAEGVYNNALDLTGTGFQLRNSLGNWNASGNTYIYIAIRRGPMKTPTDATKVFASIAATGSSGTTRTTGFPVDLQFRSARDTLSSRRVYTRLLGVSVNSAGTGSELYTDSTSSESTGVATTYSWWNTAYTENNTYNTLSAIAHNFRRAPGFFDVVAYAGTGSARTVSHNLGVAPELMIIKQRSGTNSWIIYPNNASQYLLFNTDAAQSSGIFWSSTTPTASAFSLGSHPSVNGSSSTYIAYLFATCPGVSKVGSYTGSGTTKQIDCGFTNGARFVLIKRTDSTGDWYVWDTARGIVSGNDPYLLLNSTAAEVTNTDFIDPLNSGFEISSTAPAAINANGGTYIYLAIA